MCVTKQGCKEPDTPAGTGSTGDLAVRVADPDDNAFEVVQHTRESLSVRSVRKYLSDERVSRRLLHVGLPVSKPETAKFSIEILGSREFWRAHSPTGGARLATLSNLKAFAPASAATL